ncbi:aminodeoxychorismate lyase [Herbiconiux sp. KACC 21604]|uniref:aminodeoxychorismate lyase n=1 Tax=unclassified Herbiconiux TaxID=2618217 RepID=UPI001491857A|nr:aminodeoxychorismate lyase [Herbiconiux sp. SALV-R1]QJU52273.1 aminodeoxychorismate lyase [Herbiconiux sp. SALV-R1]WPO87121.1 aminodeoxychorismate lyase [Herbiconiux sp. KACC 21604]
MPASSTPGSDGDDLVIVLERAAAPATAHGTPPAPAAPTVLSQAEARIRVDDLAVTRGDGVFESIGVLDGRFIELERHLARLAHSAAMLDLPAPDLAAFEAAARAGVAAHTPAPELLVKLLYSRGIEGADAASGWVQVLTGPDHGSSRRDGIRVVTLDRGYRHDIAQTAPWLLQGAKTLSYAVNKAALREAGRRGADDVIFVSSDGIVLEGPTSTVVVREGDTFLTPRTDLGILAGTTQAAVFDALGRLGFETAEALIEPDRLAAADGLWLLSSGRLIAPVRELDGRAMPVDRDFTVTVFEEAFALQL